MLTKLTASALLLLGILLPSCSGKQSQPVKGKVIDLSGIWDKPEEILLSSIATDIVYVPLETSPECLLGEPQNLRATILENYIAISSNGLRLFNRQGKYLRTIGSIGKGPKEYSSSGEYVIDEKLGRVDILDANRLRVVSYRLTGEFTGDFAIKKRSEPKIIRDPSGRLGIFYLTPIEDEDNPTRIEWVSDSGELMKSIPVYLGRPKGAGAFMAIFSSLYWSGDELLFNENPWDTVYHLAGDRSWEPYWIVDVGPKKMPAEVSMDLHQLIPALNRYNTAKICIETSRYIFFAIFNIKGDGVAVYDKAKQEARLMMAEPEDSTGSILFQNDLDGGLPFSLKEIFPNGPSGDQIISLLSPLDLISRFKDHPKSDLSTTRPELREKLLNLVDRLHEEDNPVLMIVKLKAKEE